MSSRALRKLQKQRELEQQISSARDAAAEKQDEEDDDDDNEDALPQVKPSKPINAFDMLDEEGQDESEDEENEDVVADPKKPDSKKAASSISVPSTTTKKKKKKAKKKKAKEKAEVASGSSSKEPEMDEIDLALKELSMKSSKQGPTVAVSHAQKDSEDPASKLLGIDPKHLNPANEMKSLFGNAVVESSSDARASPRNQRRRQRDQGEGEGFDLATALSGQHSPASHGKELGSSASRRNTLMQAKASWPLTTSGGLSMEYAPSSESTLERNYNVVHNTVYQGTQRKFAICVDSMDTEAMIGLLIENPYHIATLLQVSEIAKHEGDHSVSADLIERALYSFGRSLQSTFAAAIQQGTARVSFRKPSNREFYLAIWRYIKNLEMRGTWRTAFEWSKLLLQFDPLSDPYGVTLMIDQLALRGRQHQALIELCSESAYGLTWSHLPNIQISLALAHLRSSQPKVARQELANAMRKYPYVLSGLASALDISPLPSFLDGKVPKTDPERLYTGLYVAQAKDLWNTPETISLLVEVANTLDYYTAGDTSQKRPKLEISLEEARHIILLNIPSLIAFIPRSFVMMHTSSSDVLPPPDGPSELTERSPRDGYTNYVRSPNISFSGLARGQAARVQAALHRVMEFIWASNDPTEEEENDDREDDEEAEEVDEGEREAALTELSQALGGTNITQEDVAHMMARVRNGDVTAETMGLPANINMEEFYERLMHAGETEESEGDEETQSDSEPEPRLVATVEEVEDDEEAPNRNTTQALAGGAILRRADSQDEDLTLSNQPPAPTPPLPRQSQFQPRRPAPITRSSAPSPPSPPLEQTSASAPPAPTILNAYSDGS